MTLRTPLLTFDHRRPWFGVARTILASGQIVLLAFTDPRALLVPVAGQAPAPYCDGVKAISAYCIGGEVLDPIARHWIMLVLLLLVASGLYPRATGFLHAWVTFSIAGSIALPDGGELAAKVIALLLIPMCLTDNRLWHWGRPRTPLRPASRGIAYAALWAVRLQVAGIYLHSGLGKFASSDWLSGTAEYYVLRDNMFGAAGWMRDLAVAMMSVPWLVFAVTWGSIALELSVGVLLLLGTDRLRRLALTLVIVFHVGIIVTIGLWTFALVMIGAVALACMPVSALDDERPSTAVGRLNLGRRLLYLTGVTARPPAVHEPEEPPIVAPPVDHRIESPHPAVVDAQERR
ncbi:antimicrobial peptide system protein, SdpB family [Plantibacter sp. VKM Ac-1784]|uniref:Antimicrobial peptide system protein, SdpB family n=1 Tax=Plantibacter elymi (nom. nud.) TaxID=199708 RepID=A0ABY1RJ10_9MICO|nr:sporulation-delaying protein SdpB family protein [Plantibacter sp. VKM Ac-1784]SMQ75547.1 antimicrobial peptide system protein, SdpB family [Plantibacter sp. VKM Ac-1784]